MTHDTAQEESGAPDQPQFGLGPSGVPPSENLLAFVSARISSAMARHGYSPQQIETFTEAKLAAVAQMDERDVAGQLLIELSPVAFHREI